MPKPPPLGTVVPLVRYSVIEGTKWKTIQVSPETPRHQREAQAKAGKDAFLWVREAGLPARPTR